MSTTKKNNGNDRDSNRMSYKILGFFYFSKSCVYIRNHPIFFLQVGHETTDACIGKKYFFNK